VEQRCITKAGTENAASGAMETINRTSNAERGGTASGMQGQKQAETHYATKNFIMHEGLRRFIL